MAEEGLTLEGGLTAFLWFVLFAEGIQPRSLSSTSC